MSREAAFLVNNWILLFSAFFVLFGDDVPDAERSGHRQRGSRSPAPFFNKWMAPIGLILLFLTGVGPLLAWRKSTLEQPARLSSCGRRVAALVTGGGARRRFGFRVWASGLCFALCGVRRRHDRAGVLARRATSAARTPAPTSSRRSSAWSAATSAATAATSCTSASC